MMNYIAVTIVLIAGVCFHSGVLGKSAEEWKSRVIYQILTDRFAKTGGGTDACGDLHGYCGGTFQGIINKLDYIQGLGVNAIWISPVVEQTDGGYHGYWAKDLTKINSHFGSSDDLKQLVQKCHDRDIWVMVDVVANHMGYAPGCPACPQSQKLNFNDFVPFNSADHYHNYCSITDWSNQGQVENCRLADLPDLKQENDYVRTYLKNWIKTLVSNYDFDGIRIDTIPEVPKDFWSEFGQAAGVFQIGEVDNGDPSYVGPYQGPLTSVLNYPFYWTFRDVFGSKHSMKEIPQRYTQEHGTFKDLSVLGGFVDNHDNPRFLNGNDDWTALKNALTFTLMAQWIPIVYYGTEQAFKGGNDPNNRETLWPHYDTNHQMYQFIRNVTHLRQSLGDEFFTSKQQERWVDDDFYLFTRGPGEKVVVAMTRGGSGSQVQRTVPDIPLNDGSVLTNIFDHRDQVSCKQGKITVSISNGQPKIYYAGPIPALPPLPTSEPVKEPQPPQPTPKINPKFASSKATSSTKPPKDPSATSSISPTDGVKTKNGDAQADPGTLVVIVIISICISAALTAVLIIFILRKTGFRFRYEILQ